MTLTLDAIDVEFVEHHQHGAKNLSREKKAAFARTEAGPQKVLYPYYDFGALLSRNAVYNMAVGGRGIGKTYGAKKHVLKKNIRTGEQFIYLRRYTEELTVRDTFFADIQHEFPDWDFRSNGNLFERASAATRDDKKRDWTTMGYLVALSTAQKLKSISYHSVTTIIFDEFILEKGFIRYLPDEATVFNNFYSTVDRGQDKTRVFLLANAVSMMNPYMIEYGISADTTEITTYKEGFIAVDFPRSDEFAAIFYQTRFGQFVKDTEYSKYAVGNEFADNRKELVRPKNPRAKHQFNLQTKFGWISIWHDLVANQYYVSRTLPANQRAFTMVAGKNTPDIWLLLYSDDIVSRMRTGYRMGRMEFDSAQAENIFIDLLNRKQ